MIIKKLYQKFVIKILHVFIGKMGAVDKNNTQERIALDKYYLESYRKFQFSTFVWEVGFWNNSEACDDIFRVLKMDSLEWKTPSFISALIKVGQNPLQEKVKFLSA